MLLLLELYLSVLRIVLLLLGVLLSIFLGDKFYGGINNFLRFLSFPCIEIISVLVVLFLPAGMFYGIFIQKYFWRRKTHYNTKLFFTAFIVGFLLALTPISDSVTFSYQQGIGQQVMSSCLSSSDILTKSAHMVGSGIVAALFAFLGMDIGVGLKGISKKFSTEKTISISRQKKIKKKKK